MNLFISILFLSIWTINCLNTTITNGSFTTGLKHLEEKNAKMDNFRKNLLIVMISLMIMAFVFICIFFFHYNCLNEDDPNTETVKKQRIEANLPGLCTTLIRNFEREKLCNLEKEPMLFNRDNLSKPSNLKESSISSSEEKLVMKSSLKRSSRSPHLKKSHTTCSLGKTYKLADGHKLANQVSRFYLSKPIRPSRLASLQYPGRLDKSFYLPCMENQILLPKSSGLNKSTKPLKHRHLKKSGSIGKAAMSSKSLLSMTGQYYKKRSLGHKTPECLVSNISEAKKKNAGNLSVSRKLQPFPEFFHEVDFKDNIYFGNVSDTNDDSDRETIIICNEPCNNLFPKVISNIRAQKKQN